MDFFLCVFGMVMIIEGLPYFISPKNAKLMAQKISEMPESFMRKFGIILMLIGFCLVYIGKI